MIYHLTSRIFSPHYPVALVDIKVQPFDIVLRAGAEVDSGHPFPNKLITVARPKVGRSHWNGLLIEAPAVEAFMVTTRWTVDGRLPVEHVATYTVLDADFDAVSTEVLTWHACSPSLGGWQSRWPQHLAHLPPVKLQPMMRMDHEDLDSATAGGTVAQQVEHLDVPTIERERLFDSRLSALIGRVPPADSAIRVTWTPAPAP